MRWVRSCWRHATSSSSDPVIIRKVGQICVARSASASSFSNDIPCAAASQARTRYKTPLSRKCQFKRLASILPIVPLHTPLGPSSVITGIEAVIHHSKQYRQTMLADDTVEQRPACLAQLKYYVLQ